jgi:tetrapyrrole methylase family protein/MazG family protein
MPRVVVVGLGPGGVDLVTSAATDAIARIPRRFVRTTRHPSAHVVEPATSFDDVYERSTTQDEVYRSIVDSLVEAATADGEVLYAVPGSPLVAERTVALLLGDGRVEVEVVPALSFLDLAWVRLGIDPLTDGVRVVDGQAFAVQAAGERGPLLVAQCDSASVLSDIKLAVEDEPPASVVVLQRLGLPDESVRTVAWEELDRIEPDHLTSVYVPQLAEPVGAELVRFHELVRTLREQCPWDRKQTHESLGKYLLEETYEVLEAIERLDADDPATIAHLEEELGDVLFQVYFHAAIATQEGWFGLADVARGVHDKLFTRHPHVFGDVSVSGADEVVQNWEAIKKAEKGRTSVFDGITSTLPALLYASEVVRKAESIDAALDVEGDDLGARLLRLVIEARRAGVDAEAALRRVAEDLRARAAAGESTT